jgi:hypothetical protein
MTAFQDVSPCLAARDVGLTARWYAEHLGFEIDPFPSRSCVAKG